jgi:hypothetical protein
MPGDLTSATELVQINGGRGIRFLMVGPLVIAKFQSYGRGFPGDYVDLRFICSRPSFSPSVRHVAESINMSKRMALLREVRQSHPQDEQAVRYALKIERSPSPEDAGRRSGTPTDGTSSGGSSRTSSQSSGTRSVRGSGTSDASTHVGGHGGGYTTGTTTSKSTLRAGAVASSQSGGRLEPTQSSAARRAKGSSPEPKSSLTSSMQRLTVSASVEPKTRHLGGLASSTVKRGAGSSDTSVSPSSNGGKPR